MPLVPFTKSIPTLTKTCHSVIIVLNKQLRIVLSRYLSAEFRSPSGQGESEYRGETGFAYDTRLFPIGGKARKRGKLTMNNEECL